MNVIDMADKIRLVPDHMFPKPMLPKGALMTLGSPSGQPLGSMKAGPTALRDSSLDELPPRREITIVRGQGPEGVHIIRQEHPRLDDKGMLRANRGNPGSQRGTDVHVGEKRLSSKRIDRKEVRAALYPGTMIIGHRSSIRRKWRRAGRACAARHFVTR
jgi:hypothetical protein